VEKLYKQVDGVLHYHEAWADRGSITEHWGVVGERGSTRQVSVPKGASVEAAVAKVLRPAREAGYAPIDIENHRRLVVEYAVDGFGTHADVDKRHALEDLLDEVTGWTGIGHCDGGSIGSGTMEACCFVVDFEIAARVIAAALATTPFSDFTRIYDEDADGVAAIHAGRPREA
jgi:hypothetical protein